VRVSRAGEALAVVAVAQHGSLVLPFDCEVNAFAEAGGGESCFGHFERRFCCCAVEWMVRHRRSYLGAVDTIIDQQETDARILLDLTSAQGG
jgi:hypothetical protein